MYWTCGVPEGRSSPASGENKRLDQLLSNGLGNLCETARTRQKTRKLLSFCQNGGLLGPPLTKEAMIWKMRELCPSLRRLYAAFIG